MKTLIIRPTMDKRVRHGFKETLGHRPESFKIINSSDAAHICKVVQGA